LRDILRRYQPTRIEDLTALNALYRPGPIQGGMIDEFHQPQARKTKVSFELPAVEGNSDETYGVILYQEQVSKSANLLASFSLGEADILRRAMGRRRKRRWLRSARSSWRCAATKSRSKKARRILNL